MTLKETLLARYFPAQNPLRAMRLLEAGVLGLALLLLLWGLVGILANLFSSGPAPVYPSEASLQVESLMLEEPLSSEAASAMIARPLFWESRRLIDGRPLELILPKSEPPKPKKLEGVTLHGVFGVGDSLGAIATVNGKTVRVTSDQPIKGWRLASYQNGMAVFVNGDSRQSVPLELVTPSVSVSRMQGDSADAAEAGSEPMKTPEQQMAEAEQARQRELQREEQIRQMRAQGFGFGGDGGTPKRKPNKKD